MKNKIILFVAICLVLAVIAGAIVILLNSNRQPKIGEFDLANYQSEIETFSSDKNVDNIIDSKDAIKKAELIWIELYGKDIKKEKPYQLFYDKKNEIWLIRGTLRSNMKGGVANILIENSTGKVLAVWHNK